MGVNFIGGGLLTFDIMNLFAAGFNSYVKYHVRIESNGFLHRMMSGFQSGQENGYVNPTTSGKSHGSIRHFDLFIDI